jgi:hypothetical protein
LKIAPSTSALLLLDYFTKSSNPIFSIIKLYKMEQQQDLEKINESPKHQENFHHGSPQWKTLDNLEDVSHQTNRHEHEHLADTSGQKSVPHYMQSTVASAAHQHQYEEGDDLKHKHDHCTEHQVLK